jgi:hypothetical protein
MWTAPQNLRGTASPNDRSKVLAFLKTGRGVAILTIMATLGVLDPAAFLITAILASSAAWGITRLSRSGSADAIPYWVAGFAIRILIAIAQSGNELVLTPKDANLYETRGRLLSTMPIESWFSWLNSVSSSTRGVIALHGLAAKSGPLFRPGIYVALLSVGASSLAVAFALLVTLPNSSGKTRRPITLFLTLSPAFAFWTSQNTKEGFVCYGLSLFGYGALHSKNRSQIVIGVAVCWMFRPYIGVVALVAGLSAIGYSRVLARREQSRPILLAASFALILGAGIGNGSAVAGRDLAAYTGGVVRSGGGSLDTGVLGLSASSPVLQMVRTFFTPPPWFIPRTPFELLSVVEGLVIAIVLIATLRRIFSSSGARDFATLATFLTTFLVSAIYGLGPNIGTNVRIRTTVYPLVFALYARSLKRGTGNEPTETAINTTSEPLRNSDYRVPEPSGVESFPLTPKAEK